MKKICVRDSNRLFADGLLAAVLRQRREALRNEILRSSDGDVPADGEPLERCLSEWLSKNIVRPLELDAGTSEIVHKPNIGGAETEYAETEDADIEDADIEDAEVLPGTRHEFRIPYRGEPWLFEHRSGGTGQPRARIDADAGHVVVTVDAYGDAPSEEIADAFRGQLDLIMSHLSGSEQLISDHNRDLERDIRHALDERKAHLGVSAKLDAKYGPRG